MIPNHEHLWNATIKGKSYAKNLKLGPEMEKYLEEISNHRLFMKLYDEIVAINEQICATRPVRIMEDEDGLAELKKKLQQMFMEKYKKK